MEHEGSVEEHESVGEAAIGEDIYCLVCGYNLRGTPSDRCPECGDSLARLRSGVSQIPWTHRKAIGRVRAYWQTVWLVTFRHRRFCEDYARSVSYSDARRFQIVTVLLAFLPVPLVLLGSYLTDPPMLWTPNSFPPSAFPPFQTSGPTLSQQAYAEVWPACVLTMSFLAFLIAATGVPSYFFHPRAIGVKQQNNAVAMSYYACAPLTLMLAVLVVLWMAITLVCLDKWLASAWGISRLYWPSAVVAAGVLWLVYWRALYRLVGRIMPQLPRRALAIAIGVPAAWLASAFITLALLPSLLFYLLAIIASFEG